MKYSLVIRRAMLLAGVYALWHTGVAVAQQDSVSAPLVGTRPAPGELAPREAGPQSVAEPEVSANTPSAARGDVADLIQLIHDANLSELRTTYNGSYGASLFFHPPRMTYYVALFQNKHFWRVIRSDSAERAEAIYAGFAQQTQQLADVEIHRTRLQAQNAYLQGSIAISQQRAQRLQTDLDVARTQQAKVDDRQRQTRDEALALRAERDNAQAQLRQLQSAVTRLQQQTEAGLPASK
ncbi:DUF2968 domain-containing protein [Paraburkholderia sp. 40]|uniref:DUF2968 domain-containing protein n=1 Tax=Paraburkholderia sp. 40 TaxID=2991059 RepID=UPI003D1B75FC